MEGRGADPVSCQALDACHIVGECNPATGVCSDPAAPDGTRCNDNNLCSSVDECRAGVCTGTSPLPCPVPSDPCMEAICEPQTGCGQAPKAQPDYACAKSQYRKLALRWAPVHYQDVNKNNPSTGLGGMSDYLFAFNYDGDFNGRNNWDNLQPNPFPRLPPSWDRFSKIKDRTSYMHYFVDESDSHWFLYFMAYHPRSTATKTFDWEHENDGESCLMVVRKDGSPFGTLEGLITTFHSEFRVYAVTDYVTPLFYNYIGSVWSKLEWLEMEEVDGLPHPRTYQEPVGHGFVGCAPGSNCVRADDGIRYVPSETGEVPPFPIPDGQQVTVKYGLIEMTDLIARRFDGPTFVNSDVLAGDSSGTCNDGGLFLGCKDNAAGMIWVHSDGRMKSFQTYHIVGEDPAAFVSHVFNFGSKPAPSSNYVWRQFLHEKCALGRPMQGSPDPCVQKICAVAPQCCTGTWDASCRDRVASVCGLSCAGCANDGTGNATVNICHTHAAPIGYGCDGWCASQICAVDPYCCRGAWDSTCVAKVGSVCKLGCDLGL